MANDSDKKCLALEVSEAMERASAALCKLKLEMDRHARGYVGQPYLDDWMGDHGTCAYWGDELLRLVVPFLDWEGRNGQPFQAYVDPRFVLGASIKGYPEDVPAHRVAERIALYAQDFGSTSNALYVWHRPLGIFTAHEGKHRVAFMRAHEQPAIAAWVSEASYPAAERIFIIEPDEKRDEWLALLDGRYMQVLRRPRISCLMLRAYGVEMKRWHNLSGIPSRRLVMDAIYQRGLHKSSVTIAEGDRTLDLEMILRHERENIEQVERTIHDLDPYRFQWKRYGIAIAACLLLSLVLTYSGIQVVQQASLLLMGAASGLIGGLTLFRFVGPR